MVKTFEWNQSQSYMTFDDDRQSISDRAVLGITLSNQAGMKVRVDANTSRGFFFVVLFFFGRVMKFSKCVCHRVESKTGSAPVPV